ncbi:hypothetical protein HX849_01220 [Marine Group I thaumarchaeote]|nr:hypothetical protein [Marine Group I thaumarchaeote]
MDYRLTDEDKERVKLLGEVSKNKFKNFSLEQLIRLQELVEKKDYGHEKKVGKWKKKLLTDINVEIYKRDDAAIWK